jgi:hypothetical protein
MKIARFLSAALLAPLSVPALFFLANYFFSGYAGECCGHLEKLLWLTATFYTFMSYAFSFLLGAPIIFVVRRRYQETLKIYLVISALAGATAGCLFFFTTAGPFDAGVVLFGVAGAVSGAVVSASFCLIAGIPWGNADEVAQEPSWYP